MKKELATEINNLLHRLARVISDIDHEKRDHDSSLSKNVRDLLMCRAEILRLVGIINDEKRT